VRRVDDDRDDRDDRDGFAPPADERAEPARRPLPEPERAETPAFDSLDDPLNGPLNRPLLAPLLDPTTGDDILGIQDRRPAPEPEPEREREREPDDEWSQEWVTGTWAMAPSALDERDGERPAPGPVPAEDDELERPTPRPTPRRPARHRFLDEPADDPERAEPDGADERADPPADREERRAEDAGPGESDLGLRPESLARLSDADRQLLARLQAELLEGRKPRNGWRPGVTNGVGRNGHRGTPPDLAG
jgi:hypothetical protein